MGSQFLVTKIKSYGTSIPTSRLDVASIIGRNYNEDQSSFQTEEKVKVPKFPTEYQDLYNHLNKYFQSKIDFKMDQTGKGKITIPFSSTKDLERILGILDKLDA